MMHLGLDLNIFVKFNQLRLVLLSFPRRMLNLVFFLIWVAIQELVFRAFIYYLECKALFHKERKYHQRICALG